MDLLSIVGSKLTLRASLLGPGRFASELPDGDGATDSGPPGELPAEARAQKSLLSQRIRPQPPSGNPHARELLVGGGVEVDAGQWRLPNVVERRGDRRDGCQDDQHQ